MSQRPLARRQPARSAAALIAAGIAAALLLTACTPKDSTGAKSTGSATTPATAASDIGSATEPQQSSVQPSAIALVDARANPGAFASDLNWSDVTKQVNKAVGATKRKLAFSRASMSVPLNWADAAGKKITLTVLRIRSATQHNRIGSLVINPGGPGGSGVDAALQLAIDELPDAVLARFDIVGFDPRGIGLSHPLKCISDKTKDAELNLPADPTTDAAWQEAIGSATSVAQNCFAVYGNDLTYFSTTETVRDMEALRAKLGDPKLSYLGYSYGTLIGAEYASAYPDKVRALALDGAVDPTINTVDQDKTQSAGFQLAFNRFAAACTKTGSRCKLGADPQAFVTKLMANAATRPIRSGDGSDPRKAGDGAVLLGVISALYDQTQWPTLTTALVDAEKGDAAGILALDDQYNERSRNGTYSNIEDANAAIGCADTVQRPTVALAKTLEPVWRASNPLFGGSAASSLGFCSLWKAPPDEQIVVSDNHAPPILVIGTTGDPATPISGARHLAALLGSGRLLVWDGDGHTAYPKTSCVTGDVDSYLIDLKVPTAGTTCPAT